MRFGVRPAYGETMHDDDRAAGWAPETCTLPTPDRPLREAEFDLLFAQALTSVQRISPGRAVFALRSGPGRAQAVQDLTRRETACCSFFSFSLSAPGCGEDSPLALEVAVPAAYVAVLDALVRRAAAAASLR